MARAQVHTLEAIVAALLLLTSVLFALQMTAVTPLSASTSSQHVENQQLASAEGVLASARERNALRRAVLYWNESDDSFYNSTEKGYYAQSPPNEFGSILANAFESRGIAYNVYVIYHGDAKPKRTEMVYRGVPSDHAVRASRTVVLTDGDRLYDHTENRTSTPINRTTFYAPDAEPDSNVYNVVEVEVVVWRI